VDLNSTLIVFITNAPSQILTNPWNFASGNLNGVAVDGFNMTTTVVGKTLVVDGFTHSDTREDGSSVDFTLSTLGKLGIGFYATVRRWETGPRQVEIDYFDGAQWHTYPMVYTLSETGVWYTIGGRIPLNESDNLSSAEFRIVAYQATASELEIQDVKLTAVVPEPAIACLLTLLLAFAARKHSLTELPR
jgi:hypothetical protein